MHTRTFVYNYANALITADVVIRMSENWNKTKAASYDCLRGFSHKNKKLSLRVPESTSIGRAVAFHRTTVTEFLNNLRNKCFNSTMTKENHSTSWRKANVKGNVWRKVTI